MCKKCNNTGLIPFKKNGKVIPFAWIDCSCKEHNIDKYVPLSPDMFDFPCSYDFRASQFQICGVSDPGLTITSHEVETDAPVEISTPKYKQQSFTPRAVPLPTKKVQRGVEL